MADNRALSGASVFLVWDGTKIGWATNASTNENLEHQAIDVLGDIAVQEHEPTRYTASLSFAQVRIFERGLRAMGIWPGNKTVDVLNFQSAVVQLVDIKTNKVVARVRGVRGQSRRQDVQKGALMMVNATFYAIRVDDEKDS